MQPNKNTFTYKRGSQKQTDKKMKLSRIFINRKDNTSPRLLPDKSDSPIQKNKGISTFN